MSDLRDAFEKWYREQHEGVTMKRMVNGDYVAVIQDECWHAWQAALSANGGEKFKLLPSVRDYLYEGISDSVNSEDECPDYEFAYQLGQIVEHYSPAPAPDHSGDEFQRGFEAGKKAIIDGGRERIAELEAHIADAGKVAFVDGLGAQRMTADECKEGIEYIIHGDNIYWPLSDDDELRLIQAACGKGEFTYPGATPSVPDEETGKVAPVPWPKKEDVTEDMRAGFERLYRAKAERDGRTLERNEQGAYKHLPVDADWVFYQRAWADALEATHPAESREEIQAQGLEEFIRLLNGTFRTVGLPANTHPCSDGKATALNNVISMLSTEAARLRASQQEGNTAGDDGEGV